MAAKKVRIGGWVDNKLKARVLKHGAANGLSGNGSNGVSQTKALASLLKEAVALRKKAGRKT